MGNEWKTITIGDICLIRRGASPRPIKSFITNSGIPWVKIADATATKSRYIKKTNEYIIENGRKKSVEVKVGDLILSNSATPGLPKIMGINACIHDGWLLLNNFKGITKEFLYYLLVNERINIVGHANGTVFPNLKTDILRNFRIKLPPLKEQQKIASILSAFDDKIELNNEMNKTLEEIAQAIFKHWFIDFEFPNENGEPYKSSGGEFKESELGLIPKGWEICKIGNIANIQIGGDWGKVDEFPDSVQVYCLRGVDLQNLKETGYTDKIPLRWIKKSSFNKREMNKNDILIGGSGLGPVGRSLYLHPRINNLYNYPITYSNFCKRISARNQEQAIFLEHIIENIYKSGQMDSFISGTSIPNLDLKGFMEYQIVLPNDSIINNFASLKNNFLKQKYCLENRILSKLRNTLLPKLISGEIRVK